MYRLQGLAHAAGSRHGCPGPSRARRRGQGTVEYVALILLVALVMAGVVAAMKRLPHRRGQGARRRDPGQDQASGPKSSVLTRGGVRRRVVLGRSPACAGVAPCVPPEAWPPPRRTSLLNAEAAAPHRPPPRAPLQVPPLRPVTRAPRELPVAVFDSGVGGLTVLHECLVSLPHEDFVYLGDTARFPYGDRAPAELLAFARQLAGALVEQGTKLVVVACNSATAAALPALRRELEPGTPVLGVVTPEARLAARATRQRPRRSHRHAGHGGQRRICPGAGGRGPGRRAACGRHGRPRAAHPEGRRCGPQRSRLRRGRLPAAARRRGGHRDPRLHPLPARPSRASSASSAGA